MSTIRLSDVLAETATAWRAEAAAGRLTEFTVAKYLDAVRVFVAFAQASGVETVEEIDEAICSAWLRAPISAASPGSRARAGAPPSTSASRNRQVVLRRAVGLWRARGWIDTDPVPATVFAPVSARAVPPLTVPEVKRLRISGRVGARDTFYPAVVAGALAGAAQSDLARLVVDDVDVESGRLRLAGRGQRRERIVVLGPWAVAAFRARITDLEARARRRGEDLDPGAPLTMRQRPDSYQAQSLAPAVAQNLHRALRTARITRAGVRPASLQAYAANRCYAITNRIEDVANLLGLSSLDAARRYIDNQWQGTHAAAARDDLG